MVAAPRIAGLRCGSVARGEDGPASDIDMIADFPAGTSLLTVIGLEQALRDLLGVAIDLGPADALRKDIRDRVLAEARPCEPIAAGPNP